MHATASLRRLVRRALLLSAPALLAVVANVPAAAAQAPTFPPEVASYRMTAANLSKFISATQALKELEDENIDFEERLEMEDPEDLDVDRIAAVFDGEPRVRSAIRGAGLTSREYVTFLFAMMQAMFGSIAVQMGGEQALDDMPNGVLKDNIRFFLANQAAFQALDDDG